MSPVSGEATAIPGDAAQAGDFSSPASSPWGVEVTSPRRRQDLLPATQRASSNAPLWDRKHPGQDSLTRLEQLIADGDAAIIRF